MFKKFFTIVFLASLSFVFKVQSQQVSLGLFPEINLPTGNASSISGVGFGASLKAEYEISDKHTITASGAYNVFIGKRYFGSRVPNIESIPAKLGFKYYPSSDFYVEAQAGAAFHQTGFSKTSFIWSPGFGTRFKTGSANNKLDFGLRYESWANSSYSSNANLKATSFGFVGLKLGYVFGL